MTDRKFCVPREAVEHMMVSLFGPDHDDLLVDDACEYLQDHDVEVIEPRNCEGA